jgi:hypothetical protein
MQPLQPIAVRGEQLLTEARELSRRLSDGNAPLNKWMQCARERRMTWIAGLAYTIERLKAELA